jgi:hypothetical protein
VPQGHVPPTSAMLVNLRNGLKSGMAFAEKREKRSLRGGKVPAVSKPPSSGSLVSVSSKVSSSGSSANGSPARSSNNSPAVIRRLSQSDNADIDVVGLRPRQSSVVDNLSDIISKAEKKK